MRIESPGPPFLLSVGSEHVGKSFVLEAGAHHSQSQARQLPSQANQQFFRLRTLAFRIAISCSTPSSTICDFLTVHIECSPPLLVDIVAAPNTASDDEIASLVRQVEFKAVARSLYSAANIASHGLCSKLSSSIMLARACAGAWQQNEVYLRGAQRGFGIMIGRCHLP